MESWPLLWNSFIKFTLSWPQFLQHENKPTHCLLLLLILLNHLFLLLYCTVLYCTVLLSSNWLGQNISKKTPLVPNVYLLMLVTMSLKKECNVFLTLTLKWVSMLCVWWWAHGTVHGTAWLFHLPCLYTTGFHCDVGFPADFLSAFYPESIVPLFDSAWVTQCLGHTISWIA